MALTEEADPKKPNQLNVLGSTRAKAKWIVVSGDTHSWKRKFGYSNWFNSINPEQERRKNIVRVTQPQRGQYFFVVFLGEFERE